MAELGFAVSIGRLLKYYAVEVIVNDCFLNVFFVLQSGQFSEDMIPTVGFNMRKITKGNVTIKVWDIGGQPRFRSMWERYCRGVNAIV